MTYLLINKRLKPMALILCLVSSIGVHGQVTDEAIDARLGPGVNFTQFASLYGHSTTQQILNVAKVDGEAQAVEYVESNDWVEFVYTTKAYRLVFHLRKNTKGLDFIRIYRIE
jgi:hypothetical protein